MDIVQELIKSLSLKSLWGRTTVLVRIPLKNLPIDDGDISSEKGFFIDIVEAVKNKDIGMSTDNLNGQPAVGLSSESYFDVTFLTQFKIISSQSFSKLPEGAFNTDDGLTQKITKNLSNSDREKALTIDAIQWPEDSLTPSSGYIHHIPLAPNPHHSEKVTELPVFGNIYVISKEEELKEEEKSLLIKTGIDAGAWIFPSLLKIVTNEKSIPKDKINVPTRGRIINTLTQNHNAYLLLRFILLHDWLYNDQSAYKLLSLFSENPEEIYSMLGVPCPILLPCQENKSAHELIEKISNQYVSFLYCLDDTRFHQDGNMHQTQKDKASFIIKQIIATLTGDQFTACSTDTDNEDFFGLKATANNGEELSNYCMPLFKESQLKPFCKNKTSEQIDNLYKEIFNNPTGGTRLQMEVYLICLIECNEDYKCYQSNYTHDTTENIIKVLGENNFNSEFFNNIPNKIGDLAFIKWLSLLRLFYLNQKN